MWLFCMIAICCATLKQSNRHCYYSKEYCYDFGNFYFELSPLCLI